MKVQKAKNGYVLEDKNGFTVSKSFQEMVEQLLEGLIPHADKDEKMELFTNLLNKVKKGEL